MKRAGLAVGLFMCCLSLDALAQSQGQVLQPVTGYGQAHTPPQPMPSSSPFFGSGAQVQQQEDTSPFFSSNGYVKGLKNGPPSPSSQDANGSSNSAASPDAPRVVVTIKPLHSLVAAVMDGTGQSPKLLVSGTASPHTFQLAPSQVSMLQGADVVFAIGAGMEPFLPSVEAVLPEHTQRVHMAEQGGLFLLPLRTTFNEDSEPGTTTDPHLWMDPMNAIAMVDIIQGTLSNLYPDNAGTYRSNAEALKSRIQSLDQDISSQMASLRGQKFIAFHDGLQYFEHAFGVQAAGAITLAQEPLPGAEHLTQLHNLLLNGGVTCVLTEPQYKGQIVVQLTKDTQVKTAVMDPEGVLLDPGPLLYLNLLSYTADQIEHCLQQ